MNMTAAAFDQQPLRVWTHAHQDALAAYAACTRRWMQHSGKPTTALQAEIYRRASRMGRLLRGLTFCLNDKGRTRLIFALYRGIRIDMVGTLPENIQVTSCFFSQYYTPGMCALISAMDDGIVSGIMGGGKLIFNQRITEGCTCCRACLNKE